MPVTIKDVASFAGVSPSTVSRTCRNHPAISAETKEKVRRAMSELGYEPNFQASNLAANSSRTIGIILPVSDKEVFENTFYLEVIRGISQFCNQKHYANTVITGQDEAEILDMIQTMVRRGQVDGFILLYSKRNDPILDYLDNENLLYVLIGKAYKPASHTICVDNDNIAAGQEAVEYLYNLGHRKIGFLGRGDDMLVFADRKAGYHIGAMRFQLNLPAEYNIDLRSVFCDSSSSSLRELLSSDNRPTAMIVCDDTIAIALLHICNELGISIPNDMSIISYNNSLYAKLSSPRITSFDINSEQLGIEAASQAINHIENQNLMATKIIIPHVIIERDSCKKCASSA